MTSSKSSSDGATLTVSLDRDLIAIRKVRKTVDSWLETRGCRNREEPRLVVTELATNAILHAESAPTIVLDYDAGHLSLQVQDDARLPDQLTPDADSKHHGLNIVDALSSRWGVRPTDNGKIVWCEMWCG